MTTHYLLNSYNSHSLLPNFVRATSYVDLIKGETIPVMVLSHLDNNVGVSVPLTMFNEERTFKIAESYIVDLTSKNCNNESEFSEKGNVVRFLKPSIV